MHSLRTPASCHVVIEDGDADPSVLLHRLAQELGEGELAAAVGEVVFACQSRSSSRIYQ